MFGWGVLVPKVPTGPFLLSMVLKRLASVQVADLFVSDWILVSRNVNTVRSFIVKVVFDLIFEVFFISCVCGLEV